MSPTPASPELACGNLIAAAFGKFAEGAVVLGSSLFVLALVLQVAGRYHGILMLSNIDGLSMLAAGGAAMIFLVIVLASFSLAHSQEAEPKVEKSGTNVE